MRGRRLVYLLDLVLVVLVVAGALLWWSDFISRGQAVAVVAMIEILLIAVGLRQTIRVGHSYRHHRAVGVGPWEAFAEGLGAVLPLPVARFVALEPRLWHCFYRWVTRRPLPPYSYTYHRRSPLGPLLLVVALSTPAEILLVEILVPWGWARVLFLVAALYACFWVVALYASLATLPHRLRTEGFEVRYGALAGTTLPYSAIICVEQERRSPEKRTEGLRLDAHPPAAWLAVGGRTDLTLLLDPPQTIDTLRGRRGPVTILHLAADRPAELAAALHERMRTGDPLHAGLEEGDSIARSSPAPSSSHPVDAGAHGNSRPSGIEAEASSER